MEGKPVEVVVVFYSMYTHTWTLAQAIKSGCEEVDNVNCRLYMVPETYDADRIKKVRADKAKEAMKDVEILTADLRREVLPKCDALIIGSPTRFGNPCSQILSFLEDLGGMWFENVMVGKVGSVFGGSGTQHGGQESTLIHLQSTLMHLGLVVVGLPYSCELLRDKGKEVSGGTPYGATYLAGFTSARPVSSQEKAMAKYQGRHVATIARSLKVGRATLAI